jgi:UDP-N-acetylmuramate dehydrogenase
MSPLRRRFQQYPRRLPPEFRGRVLERVGMKRYTSFRIGGLAELMVWPSDLASLRLAVAAVRELELPWRILGAGTNLLVGDGGVEEALINLAEACATLETRSEAGAVTEVALGAGVRLAAAVKFCQGRGLAGLEWAAGIPGTVGGAVAMNAGSLGSSMAESLMWVEWLLPDGGLRRAEREELDFSYRRLQRPEGAVVVGCGVRVSPDDPKAIRERIVKGLKWRRQRQPLSFPSAGSVFKNPPGDFAGRLIEQAGLKGERRGDAQISEVHANFIVNRGRALSREVKALIELSRERVRRGAGLELELEIELVGKELS